MLVHGEIVGSIRTHHALPVYRPFHCFALGNGLFSTLLMYQRIVNLMAAVKGIGCHQLIYIEKKKKKKNILSKAPGFLVWIADSTLGYIFTHSEAFSPANGF